MRAARKTGYAIGDSLVLPNVRAAAVALPDPRGIAIGSLGIAAIDAYATKERQTEFAILVEARAGIHRARAAPAHGTSTRRCADKPVTLHTLHYAGLRAYTISGSVVDGSGYRKLTLTHIAGAGSFSKDDDLGWRTLPTNTAGA
jgi:hypothetical protein